MSVPLSPEILSYKNLKRSGHRNSCHRNETSLQKEENGLDTWRERERHGKKQRRMPDALGLIPDVASNCDLSPIVVFR